MVANRLMLFGHFGRMIDEDIVYFKVELVYADIPYAASAPSYINAMSLPLKEL